MTTIESSPDAVGANAARRVVGFARSVTLPPGSPPATTSASAGSSSARPCSAWWRRRARRAARHRAQPTAAEVVLDAGDAAAVPGFRIGLVFVTLLPLALGLASPSCRCSSVPAPWPSHGSRSPASTRGSPASCSSAWPSPTTAASAATSTWSACSSRPRAHGARPPGGRRCARHHGAHHPGPRHDDAAGPVLRLVGAGGSIGLLLVLPVMVGTIIYLFVDHRTRLHVRRQRAGIGTWLGWVFTQPTTFLFASPPSVWLAELVPVAFGTSASPAWGRVRGSASSAGRRVRRGHPAAAPQRCRGRAAASNFDDFGDKILDLCRTCSSTRCRSSARVIVMRVGLLVRTSAGCPASPQPFLFAFFGSAWCSSGWSATRCTRSTTSACRARCSRRRAGVRRLRDRARRARRCRPLGTEAVGSPPADGRCCRSRCSACSATVLASFPYYIAGFADQPAGSPVYDYSGLARCGTSSSSSVTADGCSRSSRSSASSSRPPSPAGRGRRRRPVGRPHHRVGHHLAGARRQLRRGARWWLARAPPRPQVRRRATSVTTGSPS
jgi:hypothetical protein